MHTQAPGVQRSPAGAGAPRPQDPGLVRRALATLVDLACILAVGLAARALAGAAGVLGGAESGTWAAEHPRAAWVLACALPAWLALSLAEALPGRAGPGKRALGLTIESTRASAPLSFARIAARTAIKFTPWFVAAVALLFPTPWDTRSELEPARLALLLGSNLWIGIYLAAAAMTRRRQSLHDLATGTVVARAADRPPASS